MDVCRVVQWGVLEFSPVCDERQNETTMLSIICTAQKRHCTANIMMVLPVLNSWWWYVIDFAKHIT